MKLFAVFVIAMAVMLLVAACLVRWLVPWPGPSAPDPVAAEAERGTADLEVYLREMSRD